MTEEMIENEDLKERKYPIRDFLIDVILLRNTSAFSDGFHNNENRRLTEALRSIKELIPPDSFDVTGLIAAMKEEWISVKERLPIRNTHAIVCGTYNGKQFKTSAVINEYDDWLSGFNTLLGVTHWMRFPELPKH